MPAKEWSWSYSKKKNYDTCPKRHYEVDIAKHFKDTSEQLDWGNDVHTALAAHVQSGQRLPDSMSIYEHWSDEMRTGRFLDPDTGEVLTAPAWLRWLQMPDCQTLVEQKYAIRRDFGKTSWFGNDAWYRGVCDAVRLDPTRTVGLARDWKTGKVLHDSRQLMLMAQCLFSHIPTLQRLRTEFVWLKDDCRSVETFDRATIAREWVPLLPEIANMETQAKAMNYPPKPGRLCGRYCPVTACPFHGKSR